MSTHATETIEKTALYEEHVKLKGKLVPFAGFMLPVWFSAINTEHMAVRKNAGMFDISHMGLFHITGTNALNFLQAIICNDLTKTAGNKMIYGMVLNESGTILDDIMVGPLKSGFLLVVNASNKAKIASWMQSKKTQNVTIVDLNETNGFIAIQGPKAIEKIAAAFQIDFSNRPRFSISEIALLNQTAIMLRTGYTGEDGVELIVPKAVIANVWQKALLSGIVPCGLGARDTLRLEAGLPLYGQELSEEITPPMTRYAWVLKFNKEFIGKSMLLKQKDQPQEWTTVGLEMRERVIPRSHYEIKEGGHITSGTLSPMLNKPIAMALVKKAYEALGSEVTVLIREKEYKAIVVPVPFK